MSITIKVGNVNKKVNSTFQADWSVWSSYDVVWKAPTDVDNPVFELYAPNLSTYPQWNALYIPSISTYYWITDIVSIRNDTWRISATMDALATYRDEIMQTPCFIEYGSNTDASGAQTRLQDNRQNVSRVPHVYTANIDVTDGLIDTVNGFYVISCVGASGGVTAYKVTGTNMRKLINTVSSDIYDILSNMETIEEIMSYAMSGVLAQGSAISAIRSCIWIPLTDDAYSGPVQSIYLGDFDSGVSGVVLSNNPVVVRNTEITIPWPVSDWKRMNCQILMYIPFVGTVGIPIDQCNNESSIKIRWAAELISGGVSVRLNCGDYTVYTGTGNIGVPYAIGSSNVPIQNAVSGAVTAIGGVVQFGGGMYGAALTAVAATGSAGIVGSEGLAASIQNIGEGATRVASGITQALTPVVQCAGSLSGSAAFGQSPFADLCLLYYEPIDDAGFQAVYQHPVMRMGTPLAGFCQTRAFSLKANARASEIMAVNQAMDRGVFIE